ncbi:MAG: HD domain-containing protein [Myxococcota bacterium]
MSATSDLPDQLIRLVSRAERLESFPRSGWIACGVDTPESVAAHVHGVAIIAMWLGENVDDDVDMLRLLRIALLHDIGEAMMTDLPWPVKRFVDPDAVAQGEARAADIVLEDTPDSWRDAVRAYGELDGIEARIVKAADRIQMLCKSLQYRSQNRGDVERFWEVERNFKDYDIPLVRRVLDRLVEMHDGGEWFENGFD